MKMIDQMEILQKNHFGEWMSMRQKVDIELSDKQGMFCMCGRLATGLHERTCRKFLQAVNNETVKRLEHLI